MRRAQNEMRAAIFAAEKAVLNTPVSGLVRSGRCKLRPDLLYDRFRLPFYRISGWVRR
jgi:hypothetical protein